MTDSAPDLTKLTIDRGMVPLKARRRRRWVGPAVAAILLAAGAAWYAAQPHPVAVQTATIVTAFPSH